MGGDKDCTGRRLQKESNHQILKKIYQHSGRLLLSACLGQYLIKADLVCLNVVTRGNVLGDQGMFGTDH